MLDFYLMVKCGVRETLSINTIKEKINIAKEFGYKGINLTSQSFDSNNWIRVAHLIENDSLTYILSLRPYETTPEYCVRMLSAFNEISNNEIVLNMVSSRHEYDKVIYEEDVEIEERRVMCEQFINDMKSCETIQISNKQKIFITGSTEITKNTVNNSADGIIVVLNKFINGNYSLQNKEVLVRLSILFDENIDSYTLHDLENENVIYGTTESIKEQILSLKEKGATGILVSGIDGGVDDEKINNLVKYFNSEEV